MSAYDFATKVTYSGVDYHIVEIIDNKLLLVVKREDLEKANFPLTTVVIPNNINK